jgi:hypothetical protein
VPGTAGQVAGEFLLHATKLVPSDRLQMRIERGEFSRADRSSQGLACRAALVPASCCYRGADERHRDTQGD